MSTAARRPFGNVGGREVELFTLTNNNGLEARIANYGGIVVSLQVPDRRGTMADIVLGHDNLDSYLKGHPYFGCLVGRYGNRIANARFALNGKDYRLAVNAAPNAIHGGTRGFDKVVWSPTIRKSKDGQALRLNYLSRDGEEGYPGNLDVTATYTLTEDNALRLDFAATTDADTVLSLTHHSYFNLKGHGNGDILDHVVMMNADAFTPIDRNIIPTGEVRSVEGTPLDFRKPGTIGAGIDADDEQIRLAGGYDHNWVLNKSPGSLALAVRVEEKNTGRCMETWTTEPAIQFYTGNFLDGSDIGKGGKVYKRRYGFCIEPQHYPDSPNKPQFPSVVLKPGKTYTNTIMYRFSA